jgi:hypothetical protein
MDEVEKEPLFRANKRRKVVRRRAEAEDKSDSADDGDQEPMISNLAPIADEDGSAAVRVQRRPNVRKHGIGFTSTSSRRAENAGETEDMALVRVDADGAQDDVPGSDRFVRPTGKVAVAEDKHMYVDITNTQYLAEWGSTNSVGWHS